MIIRRKLWQYGVMLLCLGALDAQLASAAMKEEGGGDNGSIHYGPPSSGSSETSTSGGGGGTSVVDAVTASIKNLLNAVHDFEGKAENLLRTAAVTTQSETRRFLNNTQQAVAKSVESTKVAASRAAKALADYDDKVKKGVVKTDLATRSRLEAIGQKTTQAVTDASAFLRNIGPLQGEALAAIQKAEGPAVSNAMAALRTAIKSAADYFGHLLTHPWEFDEHKAQAQLDNLWAKLGEANRQVMNLMLDAANTAVSKVGAIARSVVNLQNNAESLAMEAESIVAQASGASAPGTSTTHGQSTAPGLPPSPAPVWGQAASRGAPSSWHPSPTTPGRGEQSGSAHMDSPFELNREEVLSDITAAQERSSIAATVRAEKMEMRREMEHLKKEAAAQGKHTDRSDQHRSGGTMR